MSADFDAVVRKNGNSLVVTIPYATTQRLGIENGTILKVNVLKGGDQKEELEK